MLFAGIVVTEPYGYTVTNNNPENSADAPILGEFFLSRDIRHKSHKSGSFDGLCEVALGFGWKASSLATIHTSVWVDVVTKSNDVFVIDVRKGYFFV